MVFRIEKESSLPLDKPETAIVRFLPGRRLLAARWGMPDQKKIDVSIWDAETTDRTRRFSVATDTVDRLGGVAISPGGKYGAFLCGKNLYVHDLATGARSGSVIFDARLHITSHLCRGVAFSPDGKQLAALLVTNVLGVELYQLDFATGELLGKVTVPHVLANLKRKQFATCPDLQWTPSGWLLFGQTVTDGVAIEVPAGELEPNQHWLNEQLSLVLDPTYDDSQYDTLAVGPTSTSRSCPCRRWSGRSSAQAPTHA